jgi:hypothetical protein
MMHPEYGIESTDGNGYHMGRRHLNVNSIVYALEGTAGLWIATTPIIRKRIKGLPFCHDTEETLPNILKAV